MKICFWVSHIATVGGVQRVTALISSALSEKFDVTVISQDEQEELDSGLYDLSDKLIIIKQPDFLNYYGNVSFLRKVLKKINNETDVFNRKSTLKILKETYLPKKRLCKTKEYFNGFDFDIIVGVQGYNSLVLGALADELNAKTIGWQHSSFEAYFKTKNKYFWRQDCLFKEYIPCLDRYIVLNEIDKEKIDKAFCMNSSFIYNPKSFNSDEKCDVKKHNFISAGRFVEVKNYETLIDAFNIFYQTIKDWKLYLIGDGELRPNIEKKIRDYGLEDSVILTGFQNDIKKYFLDSSVMLLPSKWEGMPMIVLEALEMGCPSVTFNIDAVKPLIKNGESGIIIDKQYGANGFAEAMVEIASDENKRIKISQKAVEKAKEFDVDYIAVKWEKLFNNL